MADAFTMAPLSGEIMAGPGARAGRAHEAAPEIVVDADFETLPRRAHPIPEAMIPAVEERHSSASPSIAGMDVLRGGQLPVTGLMSRHAGAGFWVAGAVAVVSAFWLSGGHSLARQMLPALSGSQAPLRVEDLATRVQNVSGRDILFVDGAIMPADTTRAMPDLTIDVTALDGSIARYKLGTGRDAPAGSGTWRFSSRLEAPRSGVRSVSVTVAPEG